MNQQTFSDQLRRYFQPLLLGGAFIFGVIHMTAFLFFDQSVDSDVSKSYSYLVQEFSHANWEHFFNPNLPLLVPLFAALLSLFLPLEPYQACILVSGIAYLATGWLLYILLKRVPHLGANWAAAGVLLFFAAPQTIRFAGNGWLEPSRNLLVIAGLLVLQLLSERRTVSRLFLFGGILGMLCLVRGEGIFFAIILQLAFAVEMLRAQTRCREFFCALSGITAIMFLILLPRAWINWEMTGWFVTDMRIVAILSGGDKPNLTHDYFTMGPGEVIRDLISGSEIGYLLLALLGVGMLIYRKEWCFQYSLLWLLAGINFVGCLQTVSSSRYFTLNVPLFMVFTVTGIQMLYQLLIRYSSLRIGQSLLAVAISVTVLLESVKGLSYLQRGQSDSKPVGRYLGLHKHELFQTKERPLIYTDAFVYTTHGDFRIINRYLVKHDDLEILRAIDGAIFSVNPRKSEKISEAHRKISTRPDMEKVPIPYETIVIYRKKQQQ